MRDAGTLRRGDREEEVRVSDSTAVGEALARSRASAPAREAAALVRGRHYTEWVPTLDELRSRGADHENEYLALLLEIIDATEREAAYSGLEPAPGYSIRAAVVYRRRGDIDAEIAVLERWLRACPPERRGGKISERLEKALKFRSR